MGKIALVSVFIVALCVVCFAIEVEFHLYPGWNLISMPCSTATDSIADYMQIVPPAYSFDPTIGYTAIFTFPAPNVGFWALSLADTTFSIACECVDVQAPHVVDSVARNITLTFRGEYGVCDLVIEMEREGEIPIDTIDSLCDAPIYHIIAAANGFYTELYYCLRGHARMIDLDPIPEVSNAITGVIIARQCCEDDNYYPGLADTTPVTISNASAGIDTEIIVGTQGRYFLADLPEGLYALSFDIDGYDSVYHFSFEIEHSLGTDYNDIIYWDPYQLLAPNIYLYPETETDIDVTLSFPHGGFITESEPPYDGGWHVHVTPSGIINGEYGYLFYESVQSIELNVNNAWILDGSELDTELRHLLARYGFIGREIDDFVEYWLPRLAGSPWYLVYPQSEEILPVLEIEPTPDSVLRVLFLIRPIDRYVSYPAPPEPAPFSRAGFTVVEWGVTGDF